MSKNKIEYFDSIETCPFKRWQKFNKYLSLASEVGDGPSDMFTRIDRASGYIGAKNNDAAIKMLLSNMVKVSVSDSGELQKSFVDFNGLEVAKDVKGYLAWAATDATMRNYIKGSQASGGQAGGNNNHVQGRKNPKDMGSQERLEFKQQDPDGFKKAFNL